MLNWFARRLKEAQEKDKTGQGGFTLIELLVVVIIIGILAAIAIPVFLNQRQGAVDAKIESDVRNAVSAYEQAFARDGAYPAFGPYDGDAAGGPAQIATANGTVLMTVSDDVLLTTAASAGGGGYSITGTSNGGNSSFTNYAYDSGTGDFVTTP